MNIRKSFAAAVLGFAGTLNMAGGIACAAEDTAPNTETSSSTGDMYSLPDTFPEACSPHPQYIVVKLGKEFAYEEVVKPSSESADSSRQKLKTHSIKQGELVTKKELERVIKYFLSRNTTRDDLAAFAVVLDWEHLAELNAARGLPKGLVASKAEAEFYEAPEASLPNRKLSAEEVDEIRRRIRTFQTTLGAKDSAREAVLKAVNETHAALETRMQSSFVKSFQDSVDPTAKTTGMATVINPGLLEGPQRSRQNYLDCLTLPSRPSLQP